MAPAFLSVAVYITGKELKINMILAFEIAKSVWVVKPARRRFDMQFLSPLAYHADT